MVASKESSSSWTISIEDDIMSSQNRKEFLFGRPNNRIILSLIYAGLDEVVFFTNLDDSLDLLSGMFADTPVLDLSFFMSVVHGFTSFFKVSRPVRLMQILNIDLLDFQGTKGIINVFENVLLGVGPFVKRVDLCVNDEVLIRDVSNLWLACAWCMR